MPEINAQPTKNLNKKRKCSCNSCCLFPSYYNRGDDEEEQIVAENMDQAAYPHFADDLPQPLDPGTIIKIKGIVLPECSRFAVNLCSSADPTSDIALHLNPRISQRYVVRNSRIKLRWGREEVTSLTKFELIRNKEVHIDIVVSETDFLVSINGKPVCAFAYRIPIENVKTILIEGPIQVIGVEYGKTTTYPLIEETISPVREITGELEENVDTSQKLVLPVTLNLKDGFQQGWQLEIHGRVKILPTNFLVNLQEGSQLWPHPNIYLHLSPRFGYAHTKHVFVRNAWLDGGWGPEERVESSLFSPASHFNLAIRKNLDHFSIWVDGQLAGEFKFRGDVDKIDTLYIQGDVNIYSVHMRHNINDKYFHKSKQSLASSDKIKD